MLKLRVLNSWVILEFLFAVKEKKSNIKGEIYLLNEDFINNDLIKIDIIEGSYSRIKSTAQMDNGKKSSCGIIRI